MAASKILASVLAAALACAALGCGENGEPLPERPVAVPTPIHYTTSGGYPQYVNRLLIASDGRAERCILTESIDGGAAPQVRHAGEVGAERLAGLRQSIAGAPLAELAALEPEGIDEPHAGIVEIGYGQFVIRMLSDEVPPELIEAVEELEAISLELGRTPKRSPGPCPT